MVSLFYQTSQPRGYQMTEEQLVKEIKEAWDEWQEYTLCSSEAYEYGYCKGYFQALLSVLSIMRGASYKRLEQRAIENEGQV